MVDAKVSLDVAFSDHLRKCKRLPSCWSPGRKHTVPKNYGTGVRNTTTYDRSLLHEVTADGLGRLGNASTFSFTRFGLTAFREAGPTLKQYILTLLGEPVDSPVSATHGRVCHARAEVWFAVGDVVTFVDEDAVVNVGDVWHNLCVEGELVSIINVWEHVRSTHGAAIYRFGDRPQLIFACDVTYPCIWARRSDTEAMILLPREYC